MWSAWRRSSAALARIDRFARGVSYGPADPTPDGGGFGPSKRGFVSPRRFGPYAAVASPETQAGLGESPSLQPVPIRN